MAEYKEIVKAAGDLLLQHQYGKLEKVTGLWSDVAWIEMQEDAGKVEAEAVLGDAPAVRLYPAIKTSARAAESVLREFGLLILVKGGDQARGLWDKKLHKPKAEDIELFQLKLSDPEIRKNAKAYRDVLAAYPDKGHSVERLVAVNFINALLANNVAFASTQGTNIKDCGPTAEYAAGRKYHSLIPLTSAYCPADVHNCFGCAFAAAVTSKLFYVRDKSVAEALDAIILSVLQRLPA